MGIPESVRTIRQWESIPESAIEAMDPDGDFVKRWLLNPVVFSLLGDVRGAHVLDAGACQGYLSRLLARRGAMVTSLEPAGPLFRHSVRMEERLNQGIVLLREDLTTAVLEPRFDAVVANMVFLSIRDWEAALRTCAGALRPGGRLVFSIEHPMVAAASNDWQMDGYVALREYAAERPLARPVATDFHRPLSSYLNALAAVGLTFEAMAEPTLPTEALDDEAAPPGAEILTSLPNFLVASARRQAA